MESFNHTDETGTGHLGGVLKMLANHHVPTFKLKKKKKAFWKFVEDSSELFCVTKAVSSVPTCLNTLQKETASL